MRNLLFLDLATHLGWASGPPNADPRFGTYTLPSTGEDIGRFIGAFDKWVRAFIAVEDPALVAYEAPILTAGRTAMVTARKLCGLGTHTEFVCSDLGVRCFEANIMTIKKFFAGSGKAEKEDMIAVAERYGWKVRNDNEADACGGWAYAVKCKAPNHAWRFNGGPLAAAPLPPSVAR